MEKELRKLSSIGACSDAREWIIKNDFKSIGEAYAACEEPAWILWLLGKMDFDKRSIVLMVCDFARLSINLVPEGEDRPIKAIELAEKWALGEDVSMRDIKLATADAYDAADAYAAAYAYAAAAAAYAAYYAAYAAYYAAYAAYAYGAYAYSYGVYAYAYGATNAYVYTADAYTDAESKKVILSKCCDIIRSKVPVSVIEEFFNKE